MSRLPFVDQRAFHDAIDRKSLEDYQGLMLGAWEGLAVALDALQAGEPDCRGEIARRATALLYDTIGLLHTLGLDPQTLWDARHRANLAKISHLCPVCNGGGMSTDEQGPVPCSTCGSAGKLYQPRRLLNGALAAPEDRYRPSWGKLAGDMADARNE